MNQDATLRGGGAQGILRRYATMPLRLIVGYGFVAHGSGWMCWREARRWRCGIVTASRKNDAQDDCRSHDQGDRSMQQAHCGEGRECNSPLNGLN